MGKIIRDGINTIFRGLIEAMGKDAVCASGGCSIDYRMSGTYEKTDRTPRVLIIYVCRGGSRPEYLCVHQPP